MNEIVLYNDNDNKGSFISYLSFVHVKKKGTFSFLDKSFTLLNCKSNISSTNLSSLNKYIVIILF